MAIKLVVDSACDLPIDFVKQNDIDIASLTVNIDGDFFIDDLGQTLKYDDFYKKIRMGMMPSTAQVNVFTFEEIFRKHAEAGDTVIYIGIASTLSGTVNSAIVARENIRDEIKDADITVIDSLCVSLGIGALVQRAAEMIKEDKDRKEIVAWLQENKSKVNFDIVLDDLKHLKRGGRISSTTAIIGGLLGIKPVLVIDSSGALSSGDKIKGKRKVIKYIVNSMKEKVVDPQDEILYIAHADCLEQAEELKEAALEEIPFKDVVINYIGAIVGAHGGPGTLGAIYLGKTRD